MDKTSDYNLRLIICKELMMPVYQEGKNIDLWKDQNEEETARTPFSDVKDVLFYHCQLVESKASLLPGEGEVKDSPDDIKDNRQSEGDSPSYQ